MTTCSKSRNARPSPCTQGPSLRVPSSDEDFDLNNPNGDDSEDDNPPVWSAGRTPNTTRLKTKVNDPTAFGKEDKKQSEYDFFFSPKERDIHVEETNLPALLISVFGFSTSQT
jgi:hypothetical protein